MTETLTLDGLIFEAVEISEADHVLTITLNRPERKNAINPVMSNELIYALDYARQERSVRVVVLAAKGDVFCAGGDLKTMGTNAASKTTSNVPKRGETDDISLRLRHLNKPTIAKIQGPVLAGALLLVCNTTHAIAADHATFSAPEIKRGIWPFMVMGGLFRVMPKRAGLDFIMRGAPMGAAEAARYGLINETVAADALDAKVEALAQELASLAPGTMQMGLAAYNAQDEMPFDEALPFLRTQIDACLKSADAKEGITAFLEKRAPKWDQ
ncbi:MAG: enoyl-CoA hydratase/isomerase family protein [Rhodobacteraceae bacterium]|nr:enoyl-CoA hydratase/isomerase family protein [Paracoccaceae bacterium]